MTLYGITNKTKTLKKAINLAVFAMLLVGQIPVVSAAQNSDATFILPKDRLVVAQEEKPALKTFIIDATAYTSRVQECDGSPFITADGSVVRDGIIATNFLPFGTKVRIPSVYGDRVFVVADRMNPRYYYRVDVWMNDVDAMNQFGLKKNIKLEVVEWGTGAKNWDQWKGRNDDLQKIGKYGPPAEPLAYNGES